MSLDVINGVLSADVAATSGTFTVAYPTNRQGGDYYKAQLHQLSINTAIVGSVMGPSSIGGSDTYNFPKDFGVTLNSVATGTITITNKTATIWKAGSTFRLGMQRQGTADFRLDSTATGPTAYGTTKGNAVLVNFGAPKAPVTNFFATAQAVAGAGNLTLTTTLTLDRPRNVTITSSGAGDTTQTATVTGVDIYGVAMTEAIAFNGAATIQGKKAFKSISQIAISAALAGNGSAGYGDVLGFPLFIPETAFVLFTLENGVSVAGTLVAGDLTAGGATATTGDVRGTYDPNAATNDAIVFQALVFAADNYSGITQA